MHVHAGQNVPQAGQTPGEPSMLQADYIKSASIMFYHILDTILAPSLAGRARRRHLAV